MKKVKSMLVLRWAARIWGSLLLLFLLIMVGAEIVGTLRGLNELSFDQGELLPFLFFPILHMLGLGLAWFREGLGALIIFLSLAGFLLTIGEMESFTFVIFFAVSGLLYLLYWYLNRSPRA